MPDFFCHMFLGKAAAPSMPSALREAAGMHSPLFHLGCQGPDIFFYYKMLSPGKHRRAVAFANLCHQRDTRKALLYGASYLQQHPEDRAYAAYWAGFLCHYALDCCAHPLIERHTQGFRAHKMLEMHLDAYMLRRKWQSAPYRVRIQRLIELPEGLPPSVAAFWQGLAKEVHAAELAPDMVHKAYRGACSVLKGYYAPRSRERAFKRRIGRLFGMDISPYLAEFEGQDPLLPEEGYAAFDQCFAEASALAAKLCRQCGDLLEGTCTLAELEKALPEINFSGVKGQA